MATNVVMPQLGESVIEGTVGKWYKKVGDAIDQYEPIMEVVTDKVTTEIPSPAAGTLLQIVVSEGVTVNAGTVLAVIGAPGEEPAVHPAAPAAPPTEEKRGNGNTPVAAPAASGTVQKGTTRLTPVVARMIAENNITPAELATIAGSGEGGRISKKDIEAFIVRRGPEQLPAWEQPGTGDLFRPTEEIFGSPAPPAPARAPSGAERRGGPAEQIVPISPIRKAIAEHMVRSKAIAPHVSSVHEADMGRVIAFQRAHESEFAEQGVKLTYTAFFVQAAIAALQAWPIVNATYTDQGIVMKRDINIGIAVAMEEGLVVPVIKHADEKSLLGIARAVNDLASRAREKRLSPDDVQGGTFTLTNYGVFGSLFGTPVINQPQAAILGVGAIQKRVVVTSTPAADGGVNDAIAIRPMVYLSLTFDHRLLDGAIGDQFVQK
ncbi:MAG: 2-oxo acid dehydrogenase subunit E2, partial [Chloroflexi bacterium]|nr:2-oxo acid dehydrogenase subunit E2 [Chloroflexota bacterium]